MDKEETKTENLDTAEEKLEEKPEKVPFSWRSFWLSFVWLVPLLFGIDLLSKWLVQLNLEPGEHVAIIENFFYITLTYNTGAAGGTGAGNMAMRVIYILISWIMSIVFGYLMWRFRHKGKTLINLVLALCLAGALGNLIDRTFYWPETVGFSGVIDFFEFYLQGGPNGPSITWLSPFPIFNVADMCLVIGVAIFIVKIIVDWVKGLRSKEQ